MNRSGPPRPPRDQEQSSGAVPRITSAPTSLADDMAHRTRRYLLQMTIRVVCFLGAVVVDHWTRWLLLAGAVVLPYVAVVLANVGQERGQDPGTFVVARTLPRAPERPGPVDGPPEDDQPMTSRGAQQ